MTGIITRWMKKEITHMNPTVVCSQIGHNAEVFHKVDEEVDNDGTQTLVKQYYTAECGCRVEVTLAVENGVTH